MGKIFSPPKMPSYTPVVVPNAPEAATPEPPKAPDASAEPSADEIRAQNILNRRRGRLGTIATSLSGVLSTDNGLAPVRKTLLGE